MGYLRQTQPAPPPVCIAIADEIEAHLQLLISEAFPPRDPFLVVRNCAFSPTGMHQAISDCGDIVCPHCSTVLP
ncbi:hypothetical protein IC762_17500 [Bradyrhizobium genosp. L]|uniref:hypothetical protein n=1 Tax=Bradyrhizobium genosp. L TaxID=83637 RepID=UPI0018A2C54C|nr:hypothetical protein [Bradyrhizobium genosp. L]QPF81623.1 hypothetical protein IC762_17500 [Bradyrhizobium genosp. L]